MYYLKIKRIGLIVALIFVAAACQAVNSAQNVEDVHRVQPNASLTSSLENNSDEVDARKCGYFFDECTNSYSNDTTNSESEN